MADETRMTRDQFNAAFRRFKEGIAIDLVAKLKQRCPVDTGQLRSSISHRTEGNTIAIYMLDYALYVEFGTQPHIIKPKDAKALHWKETVTGPRGGKKKMDVFAKEVRHPGTAPNPFIRHTLRSDFKRIVLENARRHFK